MNERPEFPISATQSCAIGLDIGGTKIAGGVIAFPSGRVLAKRIIPTQPKRDGKEVLAESLELAKELMDAAKATDCTTLGIGLGVAELVDLKGNITSSHTIAWRGLPVQNEFSRLGPAKVDSDVRAAALAEAKFGAGKSFKLFIYITVGTGISCCLVQNSRPFTGARGNALLLANAPLTTICANCNTELNPVLEEIASGPALVTRYNRASAQAFARGEEVTAAAAAGDSSAIEVVKTAGEALGNSFAFLINCLDPEAVIVGGGLGLAGGLYWECLVASTRNHVWAADTRNLPIVPAALGVDAGLIGAATLITESQL